MSDYDDCDDWCQLLPLDSPSGAGGAVPPTLATLVQPGPGAHHQVTANTLQCYTSITRSNKGIGGGRGSFNVPRPFWTESFSYLTSTLQTNFQCASLRLTSSSIHDGGVEPFEDLRLGGVPT